MWFIGIICLMSCMLYGGKESLADATKNDPSIQIFPYDNQRDRCFLEQIVNFWENNGDPLETNWWTISKYRLPPKNYVDVARCEGKTIGFISYWSSMCKKYAPDGHSHIDVLAIDYSLLRNGCARLLLEHVINVLSLQGMYKTTVHIPSKNTKAIRLYQKVKFQASGNYACAGVTLPVFSRHLK